MSDLHPTARSLIESAKRRETTLPDEVRGRVHRSVVRRAAALGAAVATTTSASVVARAGALVGALAKPLLASAAVGSLAGAAFLVAAAASRPPAQVQRAPGAPITQPVARASHGRPVAPSPEAAMTPAVAPTKMSPNRDPDLNARAPASASTLSKTPSKTDPDLSAMAATGGPPPLTSAASLAATPSPAPATAPILATVPADVPHTSPTTDDLAAELGLLHDVHRALRAGQPDRALALLDRSATLLERGAMAEQAHAARVSALCQLGRVADARAEIERFVARWPASPLAVRLEGGCSAVAN
jgi:hypothetical protein